MKELHVRAAALETSCGELEDDPVARGLLTLELGLVLDHERLALVVNGLVELGRDGVVGCFVLEDKTLVELDALED